MKFTNKFFTSIKELSYRSKLILLILIMEILIFLLLLDLFFVPRTAAMMFHAAGRGAAMILDYEETLTVQSRLNLSADELQVIENLEEDTLTVDVVFKTKSKIGPAGAWQKRSMSFKALEQKVVKSEERYYDGSAGILYTREGDHWVRSESDDPCVRLTSLLSVPDDVLREAEFRRTLTTYQVVLPARETTDELFEAVFKDTNRLDIDSGTVIYTFNKFTRKLRSVEIRELRKPDPKSSSDSAAKEPEIRVRVEFSHLNDLESEDWQVPEDVAENAVEKVPEKEAKSVYTLSSSELSGDRSAYIVGEDLPKGTYIIEYSEGSGILTALRAKDGSEICSYNFGYDYYKIDQEPEGEEVKLKDGDRILLSGDKLVCKIRIAD